MKKLKILISAYACEPGKGSEPGIGWHTVKAAAERHEVWALTREANRPLVEAELARCPLPNLKMVYYDLPGWVAWWKKGGRGLRLYYYLWQLAVYFVARALHKDVGFDLSHHATFGLYWAPSFIALIPVPFIWGPVGGGESAPKAFWPDFSRRGQRYERLREINQWLATKDPFVQMTAARSVKALATTKESLEKLEALRAKDARVQGNCALGEKDLVRLRCLAKETPEARSFVSIGRLLHWKGYHLAIRAFAAAELTDARYWVIGEGPERAALERLVAHLGLKDQVFFTGRLSREETLNRLATSEVFLHPSLHDSGGWATLEAMAAGRPVICLDLGGPATQVTAVTGIKVAAQTPQQVVRDLAGAMQTLTNDAKLRQAMGHAAQQRIIKRYTWEEKGDQLDRMYRFVVAKGPGEVA